jgi:hypothetical protein
VEEFGHPQKSRFLFLGIELGRLEGIDFVENGVKEFANDDFGKSGKSEIESEMSFEKIHKLFVDIEIEIRHFVREGGQVM